MPKEFYERFRNNNAVTRYSEQAPERVEPRLQEIFRKFKTRLGDFKEDLAENFNVKDEQFKPEEIKERIIEKKERA